MDGSVPTFALVALILAALLTAVAIYLGITRGTLKRIYISIFGAELEIESTDSSFKPDEPARLAAVVSLKSGAQGAINRPALTTADWQRYVDIDLRQYFGRADQLTQLAELVAEGPSAKVTAVRGVGGIGKTASAFQAVQTALESRYSMVAWASFRHSRNARGLESNRGSLEVLRDLSNQLGLSIDTSDASLPTEFPRALIKGSQTDEILLVVDNLEQLADFRSIVAFFDEKNLLGRCHLLLTTRVLPAEEKTPLRRFSIPSLDPNSSYDLIRHEGAESSDVAAATNIQLASIHSVTDGNPYLMKLVARRLAHSSEHIELILRDLQEIDRAQPDNLAVKIERYMFRTSIEQLIEYATPAHAESLLYAFLTQPAGSQVPYQILLNDSGLSTNSFARALERAHTLSLVTSNTLSGTYSIHSLLHSYLSGPNESETS